MKTHLGIFPMNANIAKSHVPDALADVALIDAKACAAVGSVSISLWHAEVAAGRAPKPAIRAPRFTRWRSVDVRSYWIDRAAQGTNTPAAVKVIDKATKASAASHVKRRAAMQDSLAAT